MGRYMGTRKAEQRNKRDRWHFLPLTVTCHFLILHMWFIQNQITFLDTEESKYLVYNSGAECLLNYELYSSNNSRLLMK